MKPTILIADNDRGIRQFCKRELEAQGCLVVTCGDGDEAVAFVESSAVDLVVLDQHMPRCSGTTAARTMRRIRADLPIVLFTADSDFESFRSECVDRTVTKSEDLRPLQTAIAELLGPVERKSLEPT